MLDGFGEVPAFPEAEPALRRLAEAGVRIGCLTVGNPANTRRFLEGAGLASYVDEKMRAAAESTPSSDSVRLAVLAALNIADELFRCQDAQQAGRGALAQRTEALERLVDAALAT